MSLFFENGLGSACRGGYYRLVFRFWLVIMLDFAVLFGASSYSLT
jgi:hypothetical protein